VLRLAAGATAVADVLADGPVALLVRP